MKQGIVAVATLCILCTLSGCGSGSSSDRQTKYALSDTIGKAKITFSELEHDFGTIEEGERVAYIFSFTNTGDADLIVTSALTSCGCTVSKFDRKPISPKGKGTLEVVYDSTGRNGLQTKTITVQSNAENKIVILRITAKVVNK